MLSSRMSDSLARFSWSVLWLRLTHNGGSSWFPPHEDVLNDRQYTTRRLFALGLFSVLTLPPIWIRRLAWSPDGKYLVGGGDDGQVYVWDASDGRLLLRLGGHHAAVMSVAWSPDGTRLASGGGSLGKGEVFVWDASTGACLYTLNEPSGSVYALAWNPGGAGLLSGGSDGRLRWWDVHSGQCIRVREAHQGTVQALKVSPDESLLASCGNDGAIMLWDLESGDHLRTLRRDRPYERLNITGIRGLTEAQKASLRALGAIEKSVFAP